MFEHIVRRGILVTVCVLIICVVGIIAALRIPVQMIPDLETRTITVDTRWPGATPQDIEKEILIEQEEYLRNIPYLEEITAQATMGRAQIELDFPFGIDLTETLVRVTNALTQVPSYPENVDEPQVTATSFSSNAFMHFFVAPLPGNPRNLDMAMMRDFIDDQVRTRMSSVANVAQVEVRGGAERQIHIRIDPERLAARGLTLTEVRDAIRNRNLDVSGGEVDSGKRSFLLRTLGRFETLDDLRDMILARRDGTPIRLADVAEVELSHFRIRERSYVDGAPVVSLAVRRESGSNVIDIKNAMMDEVALINAELLHPEGMVLRLLSDDVVYVQDSVANVWQNLILGALLSTLIMYVFLRSTRATLVGVCGIPICTIAAFLGLMVAGRTINVISLAGVAFALGMTLDNSIVVLESIELERRKGLDRVRAAIVGARKVWPAVLASTLTTVMVFIPVVSIAEEAGQLYSDVAIAIAASIMMSMLVAVTLVPMVCAQVDFKARTTVSRSGAALRDNTLQRIAWLIETAPRRTACIAVTVAVSLVIVVALTPPAEYLPEGEEPKTFASMNAPPGYNMAAMEEIAAQVQDYLLPFVGAEVGAFRRGEAEVPAMEYLNLRVDPQGLRVITQPRDAARIDDLMSALEHHYRSYPGMTAFAARGSIISSNDGGTRSVNLDIAGPDLQSLYTVAQAAYRRAGEIFVNPRIQSQPASLSLAQPLLQVRPNWERAAEVGMNARDIGFAVAALTDGAYVSEFFLDDDKVDMYLYNEGGQGATLETLAGIEVYTPTGQTLLLSELTHTEETVDTSMVRRKDGRRTVTLNIIPPRSVPLETGVEIVRRDLVQYLRDSGQVPANVSLTISGAADQLDATRESLSSNYGVALVIIYLVLVAIFSHWGYPLLIMTVIPLGVSAGIAGLALLNVGGAATGWLGLGGFSQPFDMISMLGFLILMGVVTNNPILVVDRSVRNVQDDGMAPAAAVLEAVESRLRAIAISSITTLTGLAPLVFLPGAGSELYRGVGAIVMGGIVGATLVTLTLLPALTVAVLEWQQRRAANLQG